MLIDATRPQVALRLDIEPRTILIRAQDSEDAEGILYDFDVPADSLGNIAHTFKKDLMGDGGAYSVLEWNINRQVLSGPGPTWQLALYAGFNQDSLEQRKHQLHDLRRRHALFIWITEDAYSGWFVTIGEQATETNRDPCQFVIPCPELDFYAVYRTPGQTDEILDATRPTAWEHLQREDA